jgi:hypothetical protein
MLEEGIQFQAAAKAGRPPELMDMWEDAVPWGQMALTALKARPAASLPGVDRG